MEAIAVENFQTYLRIKTVQPAPDYASCMSFLKKMAGELELDFEQFELVPGKPIALMTWKGSEPSLPTILLNSHTDVVPVSEADWSVDPFGAIIDEDGRIFARGSQDMKCVGIGYLEAIRRLKASGFKPLRTVHLSFVPDEEIGGVDGMQKWSRMDSFQALNIGMALDEGIPSPFEHVYIFNQERAPWWIKIVAHGVAGHGSGLPQGTATEKLFRVMEKVFKFRNEQIAKLAGNPAKIGEVTSVNVTKLNGGVQTNVIPCEASITIDVRISPSLGEDGFERILADWIAEPGLEAILEQRTPIPAASPISPTHIFYSTISDCIRKEGFTYQVETFPGATDSRFLRELGIPAYGISPFNLTPILLHDHDEFLGRDTFLKGIKLYERLIAGLSSCQ